VTTFGSLFAGIGELHHFTDDLHAPLDCAEFVGRQNAYICQPMAVRTQDDAVLNRTSSSFASWNDVVRVASGLMPAATHANVGIEAAHGGIPASLVGIFVLACVNIALTLVPGNSWANPRDGDRCSSSLSLCFLPILMSGDISEFSTPIIIFGTLLPTPARA